MGNKNSTEYIPVEKNREKAIEKWTLNGYGGDVWQKKRSV